MLSAPTAVSRAEVRTPDPVKAIAKFAAASYHEPSARDARRRILDFFDAHLKL